MYPQYHYPTEKITSTLSALPNNYLSSTFLIIVGNWNWSLRFICSIYCFQLMCLLILL